jgi:hypothetical protein
MAVVTVLISGERRGIGVAAWGLEALGRGVSTMIVPSSHISMTTAIGTYALALLAGTRMRRSEMVVCHGRS